MELLLKIFSPFGGKEFPKGFEGGREMKAGPGQSNIAQVLLRNILIRLILTYAVAEEISFMSFSLF